MSILKFVSKLSYLQKSSRVMLSISLLVGAGAYLVACEVDQARVTNNGASSELDFMNAALAKEQQNDLPQPVVFGPPVNDADLTELLDCPTKPPKNS